MLPAPFRIKMLRQILIPLLAFILILSWFKSGPERLKRPQKLSNGLGSAYIAALFHQNEKILPQFIENLFEIIPQFTNVFISIHENGSTDKTKVYLLDLKSRLEDMKIPHNITVSSTPKQFTHRIKYLAILRNNALYNLYETHPLQTYDKVIFFNDILYDTKDFIRMIRADEIGGEYDAICGLDYMNTFYDTYATRESPLFPPSTSSSEIVNDAFGGLKPDPFQPYFYDKRRQGLIRSGGLVDVFSCWSGVAVFKSDLFYAHHLLFRWIDKESTGKREWDASECCLVYADLYRWGASKVYIDPNFITRYYERHWDDFFVYYGGIIVSWFRPLSPSKEMLEDIERKRELARRAGVKDLDLTCIQ